MNEKYPSHRDIDSYNDFENYPEMEEDLPFLPESMMKNMESKNAATFPKEWSEVHFFQTSPDPSMEEAESEEKTSEEEATQKDVESLEEETDTEMEQENSNEKTFYHDVYDKSRKQVMEENESFSDTERKYIVLVIYDIISNKQRVKMAKLLSGYGIRVQKSAFEARLSKKQYARLLKDIKKMLKSDDSVRIYKLYGYDEVLTFGDKEYEIIEDVIIV